jgi:hypothetical protein
VVSKLHVVKLDYLTQVATLRNPRECSAKVEGNQTRQRKQSIPKDSQIIAIYCICEDILKGFGHSEDKQKKDERCRSTDDLDCSGSVLLKLRAV